MTAKMTAKSHKRFSESCAYGGRGRPLHTPTQPDLRIAASAYANRYPVICEVADDVQRSMEPKSGMRIAEPRRYRTFT